MSKVVKKVFRGVKKVVKGIGRAVKKVWTKIKESPVLRTIAFAALAYFGGAALMGGLSGAAGGGGFSGFLTGAGQGLSNAWGGLTGAAGSAVSGNFATAGSQLAAGAKGQLLTAGGTLSTPSGVAGLQFAGTTAKPIAGAGAAGAGAGAATTVAAPTVPGTVPAQPTGFYSPSGGGAALTQAANANTPITQAAAQSAAPSLSSQAGLNAALQANSTAIQQGVTNSALSAGAGTTAKTGLLGSFFRNPYVQAAGVMTGGQVMSGYAAGKAQEEMYAAQMQEEEEARARYGANMGSYIPQVVWNPTTGRYEIESMTTPASIQQEMVG